jgi:hypothetical protein
MSSTRWCSVAGGLLWWPSSSPHCSYITSRRRGSRGAVCSKEKHGEDAAHREAEKAMVAVGSSPIPANRRGQQVGLAAEGLTRAENWRGGEGAHVWWLRYRSREGKERGSGGRRGSATQRRRGVRSRQLCASGGGSNDWAAHGQGREAADVWAHGHSTGGGEI